MKELKKGILLSYTNVFIKNTATFLYTPFLIRSLGQEQYGLYQLASTMMTTLFVIHIGFSSAYIKFYEDEKTKNNPKEGIAKLNGFYLILFLILSIIAALMGGLLGINTREIFSSSMNLAQVNMIKSLIVLMILNVVLTFPSVVFDCFILANEKFIYLKGREIALTIMVPIITIPALILGFNAVVVVACQVFVTGFFLVLNIHFAIKNLEMKFMFSVNYLLKSKPIFLFSSFIFINQFVDLVNWNMPNFILGITSGVKEVSIFGVANQIKSVFLSLGVAISNIFVPRIYQLGKASPNMKSSNSLMIKVGKIQSFILFLIFGGFVVGGKDFIVLWVGNTYVKSYYVALIMVIPIIISILQTVGIEISRERGNYQRISLILVITSVINLAITVFLSKEYQSIGAVIGTFITVVFSYGIGISIFLKKELTLDMISFWKKIGVQLIVTVSSVCLTLCIGIFFTIDSYIRIIIIEFLFIFLYLFLSYIILLDKKEKEDVFCYLKLSRMN